MSTDQQYLNEEMVPKLRSYSVLRPEYFGGLVFNHFLPPEIRFDRIRYSIACRCNGENNINDIINYVRKNTIHSKKYVKSIVSSTLNTLDNKLLIYWLNEKTAAHIKIKEKNSENTIKEYLSAPISLIWELTHACNLRCRHCFSSSGLKEDNELSTDEVKNNLDLFAENRIFNINFTGGEPLLRSDIFEIFEYASTKKIFFDFSTNGFLIRKKTVSKLKETNVTQVQVSIDGFEKTHDFIRGVSGAYKRTLEAIKLLISEEIDVAISCTVNKKNIKEVPKLIDWASKIGVDSFKTTLFIPTGKGEFNKNELIITPYDVKELSLMMKKKQRDLTGQLSIMLHSCYPWLIDRPSQKRPDWLRSKNIYCAAGTRNLFITSDGNVTPCPFLRDFVIGNLRKEKISDIWNSRVLDIFRKIRPVDLKGKCKECVYLGDQCFGGCRAAAFAYSNDLYGEDPFCWKNLTT